MKFRFHRGGFDESMKTMIEVRGFAALEEVLIRICNAGLPLLFVIYKLSITVMMTGLFPLALLLRIKTKV